MKSKFISLLVFILILSSCAYYNTFYNAKKFFKAAQDQPLRENGKPNSTAIQNYTKAMKKCGLVLTNYKNSKYADDALFMLAQCLFYKSTNYSQSIEKFKDLIKFYPESEFVPESHLYIAKANYLFNNKQEAYKILKDYSLNPDFKDSHPQAILLLANYHLTDKDYLEAEYYFQKIIDEYQKSDEYESAFLALGKSYHNSKKYEKSNEVFFSLLESKLPRSLKFDARYYIAYNYLLLEQYEEALEYAANLIKKEYREDKISKIQLIKARCLANLDQTDDAITLLDMIMQDNPKSLLAAEAAFYTAEIYFKIIHDYTKAIEYYNRVSKENRDSEFIETAISKGVVASQIIQYYEPSQDITPEELVNQQFRLAEFYLETLEMPDSALFVYDNIISYKNKLLADIDSLNLELTDLQTSDDSTAVIPDSVIVLYNDLIGQKNNLDSEIDFLTNQITKSSQQDSLLKSDSLKIESQKMPEEDILNLIEQKNETSAVCDSLAERIDSLLISYPHLQADSLYISESQKSNQYEQLNLKISQAEEVLEKYENEFIPFAHFVKIWIYKLVYNDSLKADEILNLLKEDFSQNKYTHAAVSLLNDEEVEFITPEEKQEILDYQNALDLLANEPEETVRKLTIIAENPEHKFYEQAIYTLGYVNYFILSDSISAKSNFDKILEENDASQYSNNIKTFYDGSNFKKLQHLPYLEELAEAEKAKELEEAEAEEKPDEIEEITEESKEIPIIDEEDVKEPEYDIPPEIIKKENPKLPEGMQKKGELVLKVEVLDNGKTGDIKVQKSLMSGPGGLDEIAVETVEQKWKFKPAEKKGKTVKSWLEILIEFEEK